MGIVALINGMYRVRGDSHGSHHTVWHITTIDKDCDSIHVYINHRLTYTGGATGYEAGSLLSCISRSKVSELVRGLRWE